MYLTEQEIMDTPRALNTSFAYYETQKESLKQFFNDHPQTRFTFLGCGSSYMLAKGAAVLFHSLPDTTAGAIAAGDYIVDPDFYQETVKGSIIVAFSRSGKTSEMVRAISHIKDTLSCPVISISMEDDNDIMPMSDFDLTMDWCYDKSVCQTRTVNNLYAMSLLTAAAYAGDKSLEETVRKACAGQEDFQQNSLVKLDEIAALDWDNVVVLADGPVCGIAEEGALAFTEIAMMTGRYFHMLDYRHGPVVISGEKTLTLIMVRPGENSLQPQMVQDVIARKGPVVTVSDQAGNPFGVTAHFQIEDISDFSAWGIRFIYLAQMIAFKKAVLTGGNPDAPKGLDAFITLK